MNNATQTRNFTDGTIFVHLLRGEDIGLVSIVVFSHQIWGNFDILTEAKHLPSVWAIKEAVNELDEFGGFLSIFAARRS